MLATQRRTRFLAVAMAATVLGALLLLATPAFAAPNPPGNNGTVKVDREPFDDAPDNEPHVGCTFQIDFYGFDEGDLNAKVTFEAWAPTQKESDSQVLLTDTVFIGEDSNAGGGSEAGLDASQTYTLDLTGITPHPKQGVHVKLTINADGSQGADVKHKVFWVTGCAGEEETTTTKPGETTTTKPGETTTRRDDHYQAGRDDHYQAGRDDHYQAGRDDHYQAGRDDHYQAGRWRWRRVVLGERHQRQRPGRRGRQPAVQRQRQRHRADGDRRSGPARPRDGEPAGQPLAPASRRRVERPLPTGS